ncbi:MAG: ABC transporter permease [Candidatus Thermofonsia Clade 1 bacterium]|jgi:peptide/nickel transport system permease protein|uniref:ABC transporter permease n=1 Tax=Candidatus Thermofonsia Clade 1 bacterium TaxID=2364210 RepID=A0A2M8PI52_9CHLR|nr:MAG: ABC transporter permease [Candidatus Thermofonsia Clade 1 bacterium]RMF49392.1 MAG: ABC transporter permease [Chloroflexota bacterium]
MVETSLSNAPPSILAVLRTRIERLFKSYLFRSLLQALFTIWLVLSVTFVLIRLMPGSPVDILVDRLVSEQGLTREEALSQAAAMFSVNFNAPIHEQYFQYLGNLLRGDLGVSISSTNTPVIEIIARFLPWTLFSVGLGLLISFVLGLLLGMLMAYWRNSFFDIAISTVASFLSSIPNYLLPIILIYLIGVQWKLLPVARMRGTYDPKLTPSLTPEFIASVLLYAILPVLTYVLSQVGHWALSMKNSTLSVLGEEYVNAAHARGLPQRRILIAYVGRNASLPLFTQLALSVGSVVGGAIIIELFFMYQGIGIRLFEAIGARDYPLMQGIFLMITVSTVLANLLADLLYSQLDPRVRLGTNK